MSRLPRTSFNGSEEQGEWNGEERYSAFVVGSTSVQSILERNVRDFRFDPRPYVASTLELIHKLSHFLFGGDEVIS
jgi:hypothetical protein